MAMDRGFHEAVVALQLKQIRARAMDRSSGHVSLDPKHTSAWRDCAAGDRTPVIQA
jgi:hypothetical protein